MALKKKVCFVSSVFFLVDTVIFKAAANREDFDEDHLMEIASLTEEKRQLNLRLSEEKETLKNLRSMLWREQNLRAAYEGKAREASKRLSEVKELMEAHLDVFLLHPSLLSELKAKVLTKSIPLLANC